MTPFQIYLVTRSESIAEFINSLGWIFFVIFFATLIGAFAFLIDETDTGGAKRVFRKFCFGLLASFLSTLLLWGIVALIPTKQDIAVIYSANWALNNEDMQKLPDNVAKVLNSFVEDYLKQREQK